jgi:hypothetical protein
MKIVVRYPHYTLSSQAATFASAWDNGALVDFEVDDESRRLVAAHLSPAPVPNGNNIRLYTNGRPHFILPTYRLFGMPASGSRAQDVEESVVTADKIVVGIPFAFERTMPLT